MILKDSNEIEDDNHRAKDESCNRNSNYLIKTSLTLFIVSFQVFALKFDFQWHQLVDKVVLHETNQYQCESVGCII